MEDKKLTVFRAPFIYAPSDTSSMMRDVLIASVPALACAVYVYGTQALLLALFCVVCSMGLEVFFEKILGRPLTAGDLSAAVTGLLIAFNLPVGISYELAFAACFIAIVIVKQLFGGLGKNFVNPAMTAVLILNICYPSDMTDWIVNSKMTEKIAQTAAEGGQTVLELFSKGVRLPSNGKLLFGFVSGTMGTVCAAALILGGIYLVLRRVIDPLIPVGAAISFSVVCAFMDLPVAAQLLSGSFLIYALFMATDPVTSPLRRGGRLIYGVLFGFTAMIIRGFSSYLDGVCFALLLANILVPYIDALTCRDLRSTLKGGELDD